MDEFFEKRKIIKNEEYEIVEKKITLFDYLSDICYQKKGDLHERDANLKGFSTFMILRYLSIEEAYLPFINVMNKYQNISKEQMYKVLLLLIPKSRKFLKFPTLQKSIFKDKELELVKNYFQCSKQDVKEFIKYGFIGQREIDIIKEKYGGKFSGKN